VLRIRDVLFWIQTFSHPGSGSKYFSSRIQHEKWNANLLFLWFQEQSLRLCHSQKGPRSGIWKKFITWVKKHRISYPNPQNWCLLTRTVVLFDSGAVPVFFVCLKSTGTHFFPIHFKRYLQTMENSFWKSQVGKIWYMFREFKFNGTE
jgi:hypothetical protein